MENAPKISPLRAPDVTFDKLLKRQPKHLKKFSRLIQHDIDRRDEVGRGHQFVNTLSKRRGHYYSNERLRDTYQRKLREPQPVSYYRRMPRDIYTRHALHDHEHDVSLPSFDISFEDWMAGAGVAASRHSFRHAAHVQSNVNKQLSFF